MALDIAIMIVSLLILLVSLCSLAVSIWLTVKYIKFNRRENSLGLSGQEIARKILDDNSLEHIKVSTTGSLMFGNSYSHYFKKVRLRRMTRRENSLTSLGMGAQKAALAVLAKEQDPDMQKRIRLVPMITFGPFAFIPLLIVGAVLDVVLFDTLGTLTAVLGCLGLMFYVYAIILSVVTLKTEKKAQERAYEMLRDTYGVTGEELASLKELFRLYNIQYINDIILSVLELILTVLKIVAAFKDSSD